MGSRSTRRGLAALIAVASLAGAGVSAARTTVSRTSNTKTITATAVTRTFSFVGAPNSKTVTIVNIDSLTINARCDGAGSPIVFAFTSAPAADLFGRIFDGLGRIHIVRQSAFTKRSKGVALYPSGGDYDTTATLAFETSTGAVVKLDYALDNSTTLNHQRLCTAYGSYIAS